MNPSVDESVAFVTGAGRGIGRATALAFAESGRAVVLGARTETQLDETAHLIEAAGGRALTAAVDVTDEASVDAAFERALAEFGRIDVLVNNAGSNNGGPDGAIGPLWEINAKAWWHDVTVNLLGTVLCSRAALRHMVPRREGRIVNVAAMSCARPAPHDSAYGASKAAVVRLTDSLAIEVAPYNVFVFAMAPGAIQTDLVAGVIDSESGRRWLPQVRADIVTRFLPAEVPARLIVDLASGKADALTGRLVRVDDSLAELAARAEQIAVEDLCQLRYRTA
jgi:NAD(P)-dependent dehydrogenase (short-subunit alcohol dehydrogenase family)